MTLFLLNFIIKPKNPPKPVHLLLSLRLTEGLFVTVFNDFIADESKFLVYDIKKIFYRIIKNCIVD